MSTPRSFAANMSLHNAYKKNTSSRRTFSGTEKYLGTANFCEEIGGCRLTDEQCVHKAPKKTPTVVPDVVREVENNFKEPCKESTHSIPGYGLQKRDEPHDRSLVTGNIFVRGIIEFFHDSGHPPLTSDGKCRNVRAGTMISNLVVEEVEGCHWTGKKCQHNTTDVPTRNPKRDLPTRDRLVHSVDGRVRRGSSIPITNSSKTSRKMTNSRLEDGCSMAEDRSKAEECCKTSRKGRRDSMVDTHAQERRDTVWRVRIKDHLHGPPFRGTSRSRKGPAKNAAPIPVTHPAPQPYPDPEKQDPTVDQEAGRAYTTFGMQMSVCGKRQQHLGQADHPKNQLDEPAAKKHFPQGVLPSRDLDLSWTLLFVYTFDTVFVIHCDRGLHLCILMAQHMPSEKAGNNIGIQNTGKEEEEDEDHDAAVGRRGGSMKGESSGKGHIEITHEITQGKRRIIREIFWNSISEIFRAEIIWNRSDISPRKKGKKNINMALMNTAAPQTEVKAEESMEVADRKEWIRVVGVKQVSTEEHWETAWRWAVF